MLFTEPNTKDTKSKKSKYLLKRISESVQNEALKVINQKIDHYRKTNNVRKLAIYEAKKKAQSGLLHTLKQVGKKNA